MFGLRSASLIRNIRYGCSYYHMCDESFMKKHKRIIKLQKKIDKDFNYVDLLSFDQEEAIQYADLRMK
jgi:hypothetical protein